MPVALLSLYALSGLTGLAFEVLWARMLSQQFAVSIFGVVVTVAAFMAGLGFGSLLGLRWRGPPLRAFALLEGGVALYALALPWLLSYAERGLDAIAPGAGLSEWYLLQGAALLLMMLLPATAMGAGFPLMLRAAGTIRGSLAALYGINACGAAAGALLPLALLPTLGWSAAVRAVAAIGLCVALAAALLAARASQPAASDAARGGVPRRTLLAYGAIGAAAIMLEIAWTRLFGMVLLRTEYVLAVILAVYLIGIGAGSLAAPRLRHRVWFTVLPAAAATVAVLSLWALPAISGWVETREFAGLWRALIAEGAVLAAVTLPVTLVLGAWLPLLARHLGDDRRHGPLLYGVNSLGAAAGAAIAGFGLIPWLGTPMTVVCAALLLFAAGMVWSRARIAWAGLALPLALAVPVSEFPAVAALLPQAQGGSRDLYRYEDAMAITHVVERADGQRVLLTDLQRMDASTEPAAVALQMNQARLPLMLHPQPRSVLFLGLGTGISAAGSLPYAGLERTAVELSRGAIEAARGWFRPLNGGIVERMRVVRDDARRFLRTGDSRYDVIIGDVFHPDLVGCSGLLSVQQFRRARSRLAPDGVFVQWLALNQFDVDSLQVVLRSFRAAFPDAMLFIDGFRLALVGTRGAPVPAAVLVRANGSDARTGGEGPWTWLGRYWGPVPDSAGPLQDEWRPRIEFRLPRLRYGSGPQLADVLAWLLRGRPGVGRAAARLQVTADDYPAFERAYIATDLATRSWLASVQGDAGAASRLIRFAYEANPRDRWIGFTLADDMLASLAQAARHGLDRRQALQAVLNVRPDHSEALRALWQLEQAAGNEAAARDYLRRLAAANPLDKDAQAYSGGVARPVGGGQG